jgi:ribonucleoside-diphosphate reductase alpha chain
MIGVADAFAFLGMDYDSTKARAVAGSMAQALAEACLRASVCLACERGACADTDTLLAASKARGMPTDLLADASRRGLRHQRLTAITSQRRLALLANNVTDALDPLPSDTRTRQPRSPGYALTMARQYVTQDFARDLLSKAPAAISVAAQRELRGAVQPWMDVPIDYELRASSEPLVLLPKSSSPSTETSPVG